MKAGCADNSRLPVESGPVFENPRECASVQLTCNRETVLVLFYTRSNNSSRPSNWL
jgi:hypothetical protein